MKKAVWILIVAGLAMILVVAGLAFGFAVTRGVSLARTMLDRPADMAATSYGPWRQGMMGYLWQDDAEAVAWQGPGMMGYDWGDRSETWQGPGMMGYNWGDGAESWQGPGMMGNGWEDMPFDGMPCNEAYVVPGGSVSSLDDVEAAVHAYVDGLGYEGLEVTEVMEFERNYYAIVAETGTGIGAMELLVDKDSGAIGPEPGPNMMWNAKYGMHGTDGTGWGGMMGPGWGGSTASGDMTISPEEAETTAQRWLDENLPGRTAGDADPFYGYYTLHFKQGGQVEGMLSVHGTSGDVWFHNWHGAFIQMSEGHD